MMRTTLAVLAVCVFLVLGAASGAYLERVAAGAGSTTTVTSVSLSETTNSSEITSYSVCFSPGGNCASEIAGLIAEANSSIHMMIYTFTNTDLAQDLVAAKNRGVDVKIVMDGSEAENDNIAVVSILNQGGINLRIYSPPNGIVHDKVAIIDGKIVITGSYNWSYSANDDNDENLLVLHSPALASQYETDFETVWNLAGNSTGGVG